MKFLLVLGLILALVVGMFYLGWFTWRGGPDESQLIINKDKIGNDAQEVIERQAEASTEFLEKATDGLESVGDHLDSKVDEDPAPTDGARLVNAFVIAC